MALANGTSLTISTFSTPTVTVTGLSGLTGVMVGDTIVVTGANIAGNNGYFTVASIISSSSLTYTNSSAVQADSHNGSISWSVNEIRIDSGVAATISSFSTPTVTVTGLANLLGTSGQPGGYTNNTITISNASTGANNGTFQITNIVSTTSLTYTNSSGVAGDAHNGSIFWTINNIDRGKSNWAGPRQNLVATADLVEQPPTKVGSYSGNPSKSNINNLDRDKTLTALVGQSSNSIPIGLIQTYYSLTAVCSTGGIRQYWTDTAISLVNAPVCTGGYVLNSLTVLGQY